MTRSYERPTFRGTSIFLGADGKRYAVGDAAATRIAQHLDLRAEGLTVRTIATRTGWSYPTVWRDVTHYEPVSRDQNETRETEAVR